MFEFHQDKKAYFEMQIRNAEQYVIPFIEEKFKILPGMRVLEIGCGEGGVLKAFINKGCVGVGVELDTPRLELANAWMQEDVLAGKARFVSKDIYQADVEKDLHGSFDLIVLKDVIEHIHDQNRLIGWMKTFLNPTGAIFFGFPPWQMPFGGHQQICRGKWLSKLPYYHLLPAPIYQWILNVNHEDVHTMMEIKETGISIERFNRLVVKNGYTVVHQRYYFINPIYQYKFGWKPKEVFGFVNHLPWIRNFFTTCVYSLIQVK